jgi:hypothetical protein
MAATLGKYLDRRHFRHDLPRSANRFFVARHFTDAGKKTVISSLAQRAAALRSGDAGRHLKHHPGENSWRNEARLPLPPLRAQRSHLPAAT